jgi:nucleoside-diphosphate-sugar epimerase
MFHALYGVDVAIARIFMVYGPAQPDINKLIPYVCLSAARGEAPALTSGGRLVDWIFVDDVAEGLLALGASPVADGRHVDLGTGEQVTTGEIAEKICSIAGTGIRPEFGAVPDRPMEQVRVADLATTESLTGWRPRVGVDEGLERTYRWYRDHDAEKAVAGEHVS